MNVYIDANYKVHLEAADEYTEVEADFFNGMCPELIAAYRYVPAGMSWTRGDGEVFVGPMFAPHENIRQYEAAQRAYEQEQLADMHAALTVLGVSE